jgi:hypothetical protein
MAFRVNKVNKHIITAFVVILIYLLVGSLFFHKVENWSYTDSFYATGITLSTVGYGDFTPKTLPGKLFSVFLAFSGVGLVGLSIVLIGQKFLQHEIHNGLHRVLHNAGGFLRKEEREIGRALHRTLTAMQHEEKELEAIFKENGIRNMNRKGRK